MRRVLIAASVIPALAGCSVTQNVMPVSGGMEPATVICIEDNPSVTEPEILSVIANSITSHGYRPKIYQDVPDDCAYRLTYVAYRKWDFTTFLSQADIRLFEQNELIGQVFYKLPNGLFGGGGLSASKWASTEEKIGPLMDELLRGASGKG
ncbi:Sbal_3080 family lipoprotein [Thalassospira povalilytica]|uniref:Sbal_3080 family lipoprotein n=1 Tax=Thalassospira povalilytica TaxID=732237 RepID=UPI003AA7D11D